MCAIDRPSPSPSDCSSAFREPRLPPFAPAGRLTDRRLVTPISVGRRCRRPIANRREGGFETPALVDAGDPDGGLPVQPNVLETKIVDDAVDHHRPIFDWSLPTICEAVVEYDWPGAVLCQLSFDLPYQLFALAFVG